MRCDSTLSPEQFESILSRTAEILTGNLRSSRMYHGPEEFKIGTRDMLAVAAKETKLNVDFTFHHNAFPDIKANGFGIETKYTKRDTWTSVANSIFEGMRDPSVNEIYVMFGKGGGDKPEARWALYQDCVSHVRTSNAPRFVVDLAPEAPSLFEQFSIAYNEFAKLTADEKMEFVRDYWRDRLAPGERLWWLEPDHTLPLNVRLYTHLTPQEKRVLRAEAALLCPIVVSSGSIRGKYYQPAVYALTQWGVLCPQARDLFSAGSVAEHVEPLYDDEPYISRAMRDIEDIMADRAHHLDNELFIEYWGKGCPPCSRLTKWLEIADQLAFDWRPSDVLFKNFG